MIRSDQTRDQIGQEIRPTLEKEIQTRISIKVDQNGPRLAKADRSRPKRTKTDQSRPQLTEADKSRTSSTFEKPHFVRISMNFDYIRIEIRIEFRRILITHGSKFGSNVELFVRCPTMGSNFSPIARRLGLNW
mgnify:CR=1 FL=1